MKGLYKIPTQVDLAKAYNQLQSFKSKRKAIEENQIALWSQWTRFDPRLGEILADYLLKNWESLNPVQLNSEIKKLPWPAALGVILETSKLLIEKNRFSIFSAWSTLVMSGIKLADNEQFFIGLNKLLGAKMMREVMYPLKIYRKWGYLSSDPMINKALLNQRKTIMPKAVRLALLNESLRNKKSITVSDYMNLLAGSLNRRQAERDLKEHKGLIARGFTRNRVYKVR